MGVPEVPEDGVEQASAYLRMLLTRPGGYRSAWERHVEQPSPDTISYPAVAGVLGQTAAVADPQLLARRSLEGTALADEDLELFVAAFGIRDRQAARLRQLRHGSGAVRVLHGDSGPDAYTATGLRHDLLSVHDVHTLGADGRPAEHETIQLIRSRVAGLDRVPYRFDTDELVVDVVRGGRLDTGVYRLDDRFHAVDILLDRPLDRGQTALMQMHATFGYATAPAPLLRRVLHRPVRDLTMWVRFDPARPPARVWQLRWDPDQPDRVLERWESEVDSELSVRARFGAVRRGALGFAWEWD